MQGNSIGRNDNAGCAGCGFREDVGYTLNTVDQQAVATFDARSNGDSKTVSTITGDHNSQVTDYTNLCVSKYVVRRLTPLECNRLQGFPDDWGSLEHKDALTDEEAEFWEHVRKVHADANGKKYRPLKREALVKWYNGLSIDSNQYKMWGNGIALPCALFVMEGIAKELRSPDEV